MHKIWRKEYQNKVSTYWFQQHIQKKSNSRPTSVPITALLKGNLIQSRDIATKKIMNEAMSMVKFSSLVFRVFIMTINREKRKKKKIEKCLGSY